MRHVIDQAIGHRPMTEIAEKTRLSPTQLSRIRHHGHHCRDAAMILRLLAEIGVDASEVQRLICQNGTPKTSIPGEIAAGPRQD